jgi:hypothetical protein
MIQVVIFVELLPRIAVEIGKGEKILATFSVDQSILRQEDGRTSLHRASLLNYPSMRHCHVQSAETEKK